MEEIFRARIGPDGPHCISPLLVVWEHSMLSCAMALTITRRDESDASFGSLQLGKGLPMKLSCRSHAAYTVNVMVKPASALISVAPRSIYSPNLEKMKVK
jgi:hypothetical protein